MFVAPMAVPAVATGFVFTIIALSIVCLKVYTRVIVIKNVGAEDFLIIGAMVRLPNLFASKPNLVLPSLGFLDRISRMCHVA